MPTKEKAPVVFPEGLHPMTAKKIGNSVIVNTLKFDGSAERLSRQMTKDEYAKLASKLELYNKKPSETRKVEIVKLMAPAATAKKAAVEKTQVAAKAIEKKIKKEEKKEAGKSLIEQFKEELEANPAAIPTFEAIIKKLKKVEEVQAPLPVHKPVGRRGEY